MQNGEFSDPKPNFRGQLPGANAFPLLAILLAGIALLGAAAGWLLTPREPADAPAIAALPPEQLPDALPTLTAAAQTAAKSDPKECRFPLGFITVSTPGNPAGRNVSFRTSKYQSPIFHVTDAPQRIAIPNPLPETGGIDLLSADGDIMGPSFSLYPTALMDTANGTASIRVIWRPQPACKS